MKTIHFLASLTLSLPLAAWSLPSHQGITEQGEHSHHHDQTPHAHGEQAGHPQHIEQEHHAGHDDHSGHDDHEPHVVELDSARSAAAGVTHATAAARSLARELSLYGQLTLLPDGLTHVRARFDGVVKAVLVNTGQQVTKGQPLAVVESNESLKNFQVLAPQAGQVHSLQVTAGELTREGPLLTLINGQTLWAQLQVFPLAIGKIQAGQPVRLSIAGQTITGHIDHVVMSDGNQPISLARVKIDNSELHFSAGTWLRGVVTIATQDVAVAVHSAAVQALEGRAVVFVKEGDRYQARPVELGLQAEDYVEIVSGLRAGEEYALEQSYLLKADAEKAGAEHHH